MVAVLDFVWPTLKMEGQELGSVAGRVEMLMTLVEEAGCETWTRFGVSGTSYRHPGSRVDRRANKMLGVA